MHSWSISLIVDNFAIIFIVTLKFFDTVIHVWKNCDPECEWAVSLSEVIRNLKQVSDRWRSVSNISQGWLRVESVIFRQKRGKYFLSELIWFEHYIIWFWVIIKSISSDEHMSVSCIRCNSNTIGFLAREFTTLCLLKSLFSIADSFEIKFAGGRYWGLLHHKCKTHYDTTYVKGKRWESFPYVFDLLASMRHPFSRGMSITLIAIAVCMEQTLANGHLLLLSDHFQLKL